MKLLILTQKVDSNDPILGFFHRWIIEFSKHVELLTVICLKEGKHDLPDNVRVFSLGKERGVSKIKYILNFYSYIWKFREDYDSVFVHMNQIYIIMGGLFWRLWNKKISLWYVHKQKSISLKVAFCLTEKVFTSVRQSFPYTGKRVVYLGHGIPFDIFSVPREKCVHDGVLKIVIIGRISRIKNIHTAVKALREVMDLGINARLTIVGGPVFEDDSLYYTEIKRLISDLELESRVYFTGPVENSKMPEVYWNNDLLLNMCPDGGMDKVVLEAVAARRPVIVANHAFNEIMIDTSNATMFEFDNEVDLAHKIEFMSNETNREFISKKLYSKVKEKMSLEKLIGVIIAEYETGR